jgi:hypothetical protein
MANGGENQVAKALGTAKVEMFDALTSLFEALTKLVDKATEQLGADVKK